MCVYSSLVECIHVQPPACINIYNSHINLLLAMYSTIIMKGTKVLTLGAGREVLTYIHAL